MPKQTCDWCGKERNTDELTELSNPLNGLKVVCQDTKRCQRQRQSKYKMKFRSYRKFVPR